MRLLRSTGTGTISRQRGQDILDQLPGLGAGPLAFKHLGQGEAWLQVVQVQPGNPSQIGLRLVDPPPDLFKDPR